ncbi:MAG TPA: SDR family NAD(P)-dependent oxidoreductase [Porticoccaceae bacterium]
MPGAFSDQQRSIRNPDAFRRHYGPWALITGASEGTGEHFALQLAEAGLDCVLVARREEALNALARRLEDEYAVRTRTIVQDLSSHHAGGEILARVADLEIGLLVANAGVGGGGAFHQRSLQDWKQLVQVNVHCTLELCHGLVPAMLERNRGGLLLMGSRVGLGGITGSSVYAACKGFTLNLAEALWVDYRPHGLDVLNVLAPAMDTPSLRRAAGAMIDAGMFPDLYQPEEVVRMALEALPDGPCLVFPVDTEKDTWQEVMVARRTRAATAGQASRRLQDKTASN